MKAGKWREPPAPQALAPGPTDTDERTANRQRHLRSMVLLFIVTAALCGALDWTGGAGFDWLELYFYKMRVSMYAQQHPELNALARKQIVVVSISDGTFTVPPFDELHGPPLPRDYHAKVVNDLTRAGAKAIAFDLVFDIPKPEDVQLAAAARKSGRVIWASLVDGDLQIRPNPTLLQASPHHGHIIVPRNAEHPVIDHIQVIRPGASGQPEPSLSLEAVLMAKGLENQPIRRVTGGWQAGDFFVPADADGNLQISFYGQPEEVFPPYPYENIYVGGVDDPFTRRTQFFRDKIVLIGDTTKIGNDLPYTPIGEMAGVELHAHAIATLLQGQFIRAVPAWANFAAVAILGGLVCLFASWRRMKLIIPAVGLLSVIYPLANIALFLHWGWALHLIGPSSALFLAAAGVLIERGLSYEREREQMFDALVFAAASAIEDRDPSTSGHSRRVTQMTLELARVVSASREGRFKKVRFGRDDMRALSYAGQLHDFGKIGVREAVLTKSHKVEPVRFRTIKDRLLLLRSAYEKQAAQCQIEVLLQHPPSVALPHLEKITAHLQDQLASINADLDLLERANDPTATYMPDEDYQELRALLERLSILRYEAENGTLQPILTPEEVESLSIRRGTLTPEEYIQVQDHAQMSYNFLRPIPWTDEMKQIPDIAYAHHEKLDGSGYPRGLRAEQISLEARMMTVADIYDALTASDRPYKKAMPPERALQILRDEAAQGQLDSDLVELFITHEVYKRIEGGPSITASKNLLKIGIKWRGKTTK